jgi:SAM-dependent methyltransferase
MLREFGEVEAIEIDAGARAIAERRLGKPVLDSPLPDLKGIDDHAYDLIGSFDVIEHVPDDAASLASIARRLKPGGRFVMTVPAHQWMWSAHDVVNHHQRRYSKRALKRLVEESPLRLEKIGYLNSLLFPLAVANRLKAKITRSESGDVALPPAPINTALERAFAAERHLIGRVPLPPGLSLFAVASAT